MTATWPAGIRTLNAQWSLLPRTRSGGASIFGAEQVEASPAARWQASLDVSVRDQAQIRAWRALLASLRGRARDVLVPVCSSSGPSRNAVAGVVPHSDGTRHSDGTPYAIATATVAIVGASIASASSLMAIGASAPTLEPGQMFSLPDGRMHMIASATFDGAMWQCAIVPATRAAYAAGTTIELDEPLIRMRLAEDQGGALELELLRFAQPTLELVEAW